MEMFIPATRSLLSEKNHGTKITSTVLFNNALKANNDYYRVDEMQLIALSADMYCIYFYMLGSQSSIFFMMFFTA